jgi:hypothetical protein
MHVEQAGISIPSTERSRDMWILVRLALTCGLGCIVVREWGYDLGLPGHGDPFIETATLVMVAVILGELAALVLDALKRRH